MPGLKQTSLTLAFAFVLPLAPFGQTTEPTLALPKGTSVYAELTKPLDAKKVKPGGPVEAKVTQDVKVDGKVVIRKGTPLIGHVTQAQGRTKEQSNSTLGIVFDKAVLQGGRQILLNAVIQTIAPPVETMDEESISPLEHHGLYPRGAAGALAQQTAAAEPGVKAPGVIGDVASSKIESEKNNPAAGGSTAPGSQPSANQGAIGLRGLVLSTPTTLTGGAQGSVISSTSRNVKLDIGTQILLHITGP